MTKSHVDLLYKLLEEEFREILSSKNNLIANGVITHSLLWTIFEPDEPILSIVDGRQRVFSFESGEMNKTGCFVVKGKYIDSDGSKFGYMSHSMTVFPYEGTSSITELPVFPLAYHSNHAAI